MKICAILNREAGTLRSQGTEALETTLQKAFEAAGHEITIRAVEGADVRNALEAAAETPDCDTILATGGDGTISTAAGICLKAGKTLGVLPAGTMNLFARTLNIPLDLGAAVEALAKGRRKRVDIASANGQPILHQYSVGLQPHLVRERKNIGYQGRLGKVLSGIRSALRIAGRHPAFTVEIIRDGNMERRRLSVLAVSNNLHGEGHIPYPDELAGNVLGLYLAPELSAADGLKLIADLVTGNWSANPNLEIASVVELTLRFPDHERHLGALIDGEMVPVEAEVAFKSHKAALSVLVPDA